MGQNPKGDRLMATYRYVQCSFWADPFILGLTPEEKYFYLYLITNPHTKQCGIYELPHKLIELETGYNAETVQKLLNRFRDYDKVSYSTETYEVFIHNWLRFNRSDSPKVLQCIIKELNQVKNSDFQEKVMQQLKGYGYSINTLSKDYASPIAKK